MSGKSGYDRKCGLERRLKSVSPYEIGRVVLLGSGVIRKRETIGVCYATMNGSLLGSRSRVPTIPRNTASGGTAQNRAF